MSTIHNGQAINREIYIHSQKRGFYRLLLWSAARQCKRKAAAIRIIHRFNAFPSFRQNLLSERAYTIKFTRSPVTNEKIIT